MQNISFPLKKAKLWRHVKRTAVAFPLFKAKKDYSKDQMKKIYTWKKKIYKFQKNACKTIAKFRKMCTDIV